MKHQEYLYSVITDQLANQKMYGILAANVGCVHRLSTDRQEVEFLVERFNALELSSVHFYEAIDDFRHDLMPV